MNNESDVVESELIANIEELEANLILALSPVWKLPKPEQAKFLEKFVNETIKKAQTLHEPVPFAERIIG